jgi:hypothetical protein
LFGSNRICTGLFQISTAKAKKDGIEKPCLAVLPTNSGESQVTILNDESLAA